MVRRWERLGTCLETALTKGFTRDQENWSITKNDQSPIKGPGATSPPLGL